MRNLIGVICVVLIVFLSFAETVLARNTILTGGLDFSYDYQERDRDNENAPTLVDEDDGDYNQLRISPLMQIVSSSQRDRFELTVQPGVNYDLDDSETDIDENYFVSAERFVSRKWRVSGSNRFFRSDYDDTEQDVEEIRPDLTEDIGRRRYYRNTLNLGSDYFYGQDSLVNFGASWIVLRNDDDTGEINDYDRYRVGLRNEHRVNVRWKTIADFAVVRGEFEETDPTDISEDLYEYYGELGVENNSFANNPLTVTYNYLGTRYDDDLQDYSDIHQLLFSWRRDWSPQFFTVVGAGPSYEKTEGRDENWGSNAIVEADYQFQKGSYRFILEKGFGTNNFAGDDELGVVDFWDARFFYVRQLTRNLTFDCQLAFYTEERDDPTFVAGSDDIQEDRYTAGFGLAYNFLRYYTASLDYSYFTQDSDQPEDNYDDHRIVLTLSWLKDLMRW